MKRKSGEITDEDHVETKQEKEAGNASSLKEPIANKKPKHDSNPKMIYVSLDLETTGTSVTTDEIIQIGLIKFDFETETVLEEYQTLIKPSKPIPDDAKAVHHLSNEDVADAKPFAHHVRDILAFIGDHGLVGHNLIEFDLPLLQAELRRAKHKELDCSSRSLLDTLVIYRKQEPHTLSKAAKFYCDVDYVDEAHNARNDAMACMNILHGQRAKYADLFQDLTRVERMCRPFEYYELIDDGKDVMLTCGKYKGKRGTVVRKTDKGYWTWMLNKEKANKTKWYAILQSL